VQVVTDKPSSSIRAFAASGAANQAAIRKELALRASSILIAIGALPFSAILFQKNWPFQHCSALKTLSAGCGTYWLTNPKGHEVWTVMPG
jgi:hypothetical protein